MVDFSKYKNKTGILGSVFPTNNNTVFYRDISVFQPKMGKMVKIPVCIKNT